VLSLSKTKNVDRLMSASSSSPRVTTDGSAVRCDGAFAVGATPAEAPPAIAKDMPAAPHTGKAIFGRLCFEVCFARAIVVPPTSASKYPVANVVMVAHLVCFA
jgi:hypothetical protein